MSVSNSTKAPNGFTFKTLPLTDCPTLYFLATLTQGSSCSFLIDKEIFEFSTAIIAALTLSPT